MINARYTIVLADLIESGFDIGLKEYPIWDEKHREELNQKILDHYWFREIGAETPARFKFYLNRTLREIMPYYIKLYETMSLEYNPIHNVDYTEEYTITRDRDRTDNSESSGTTTGSSSYSSDTTGTSENTGNVNSSGGNYDRLVEVDTPQGVVGLNGFGTENEGEFGSDITYASKINFNSNKNNSNSTSNDTGSSTSSVDGENEATSTSEITGTNTSKMNEEETYQRHLKGNYGVKSSQQMIREERDLIVNIDMMIVADLNDCFMNIY